MRVTQRSQLTTSAIHNIKDDAPTIISRKSEKILFGLNDYSIVGLIRCTSANQCDLKSLQTNFRKSIEI